MYKDLMGHFDMMDPKPWYLSYFMDEGAIPYPYIDSGAQEQRYNDDVAAWEKRRKIYERIARETAAGVIVKIRHQVPDLPKWALS